MSEERFNYWVMFQGPFPGLKAVSFSFADELTSRDQVLEAQAEIEEHEGYPTGTVAILSWKRLQ